MCIRDRLQDGKISFGEKFSNLWMKLSRGTPHDRFEKIADTYRDVCKDTREQLDIENDVMDAYIDFRFAIKEAEVLAQELLEVQKETVGAKKTSFEEAGKATEASKAEGSEKSQLQLKRDEAMEAFNKEDRSYQLIKDVAEDLKVAYNVGETLITKLKQTCLLYTSPSPRDATLSRMPSSA